MNENEVLKANEKACASKLWPCAENCETQEFTLIRQSDIRGLLHCHTAYDQGQHDLAAILETARCLGLEYLGITDHARSDYYPDGLDREMLDMQGDEIKLINKELVDFTFLHGVEVEADAEGNLPLSDEQLSGYDYVVATIRNGLDLSFDASTERAVHVVMNPFVSILGHPVGNYMTGGNSLPFDIETVLAAAARAGVAVSIDANPDHSDLDMANCRRAQEIGARMIISSNAHRAARLGDYRHGTVLTQMAGLCRNQILNTLDVTGVKEFFQKPVS
jgi:DNA polymerase (family X)